MGSTSFRFISSFRFTPCSPTHKWESMVLLTETVRDSFIKTLISVRGKKLKHPKNLEPVRSTKPLLIMERQKDIESRVRTVYIFTYLYKYKISRFLISSIVRTLLTIGQEVRRSLIKVYLNSEFTMSM